MSSFDDDASIEAWNEPEWEPASYGDADDEPDAVRLEWIDAEIARLEAERADIIARMLPVDGLGDDESVDERNARIRRDHLAQSAAEPRASTEHDPRPSELDLDAAAAAKRRDRAEERSWAARSGPVRVAVPGGGDRLIVAKDDVATVRDLLAAEGARYGFPSLDAFAAPFRRGHLSAGDVGRRNALAVAVVKARDAGATLETVGETLGLAKQRVADLEKTGRDLAAR
jgi:hypothetical protein